jgi:catechol 2,3-dioxygenase-like lactoylglutathione lyase family enzyme
MRAILVVMGSALCLSSADFRIDHVTVAGRDIRTLQANLAAVGLPSVYGGAHHDQVTEMALASFPDGSYLEAIAPRPNADPQLVARHVWARFLEAGDGPCAWALRVNDVPAEVERLKAAGIAVSDAVRAGRQRPDGVQLEWETADIGGGIRGTFFPFLIHDFTARDLRAFPHGRPENPDFRRVTRVVIAVRNLDDAVARYRRAFGLPGAVRQVDESFGAHLAMVGDAPVVLAQPLSADSWLGTRLDRFGEGPCAFILGAHRTEHYHAESRTHWFGIDISWFDSHHLGWRLGFESLD